jgi:hypothetical protein
MRVYTRRTRDTGELLTVARAGAIGADDDGGAWVTFCEDHGTLINSDTRQLALDTRGMDFCDDCRAVDASVRAKLGVQPARCGDRAEVGGLIRVCGQPIGHGGFHQPLGEAWVWTTAPKAAR